MQSGALAHHYKARTPEAGLRLRTCNFHSSFIVLYVSCVLYIVHMSFPSSDRFPLTVLLIPCLWTACSAVLYMAVTYVRVDVSCLPCDTRALGFLAEGECYGAAFHPWS
jgi:RsiW-degrading membrane proteinase PrsW (M82 family)